MNYLSQLDGISKAVTIAAPSIYELLEAAEIARSDKKKAAIHELVSSLAVLPLDSETAWAAGRLSAELMFAGDLSAESSPQRPKSRLLERRGGFW